MIDKKVIERLVEEALSDGMFLVDITVSKSNAINIFVDSNEGMPISDYVTISRHIEGNLDREAEDFELQVSSPGLGQPFKVFQQYEKNKGREVEVNTNEEEKWKGILTDVNKEGIVLEVSKKVKIEGKKKKELIVEKQEIAFNNIKSTKTIISFK